MSRDTPLRAALALAVALAAPGLARAQAPEAGAPEAAEAGASAEAAPADAPTADGDDARSRGAAASADAETAPSDAPTADGDARSRGAAASAGDDAARPEATGPRAGEAAPEAEPEATPAGEADAAAGAMRRARAFASAADGAATDEAEADGEAGTDGSEGEASAVPRATEDGEGEVPDAVRAAATAQAPEQTLFEHPEEAPIHLADRIGPFTLGDDDARLQISAFAQLWLRIDDREQAADGRDTSVALDVRRIRPILRGAFVDGTITSVLHIDVSPGRLELIDLWLDAKFLPELRLRAGQFKVPFTQYWQQSLVNLLTVDWPLTSRWFGGERQLGLMIHDNRRNPAGLQYGLGIFGGENRRGAFARELPAIYGETHGNPSALADPRLPEDLHAEIIGRIGHYSADVHPETIFDISGGGFRHGMALSVAWDTDPVPRRDWALRLAPEILLKYEGWSLTAIAYLAFIEDRNASIAPGALGGLAQIGWQPDPHFQVGVSYARVDLFDALREDARAFAESLRPTDPEGMAEWSESYGDVGQLSARHELALVVHFPIIGRSLDISTDVSWLRTERDDGDRDDIRVRTQLQLAF
jgi:hypothetical protein